MKVLVNVFYKSNALLGEGLFVGKRFLYWLDIGMRRLIVNSYDGCCVEIIDLPEQASAIWKNEGDCIYLVSESGLCAFNLITKKWSVIAPIDSKKYQYRGNDGGILFPGEYLFGTMQKQPDALVGSLYLTNGVKIREVFKGIGIPNLFVKINETEILVSDSFCRKIYKFKFSSVSHELISQNLWLDLQDVEYTPDGGCMDAEGNIYIAMWDGACINKYNKSAVLLDSYSLPAIRPTNCKISNDMNFLFVTTATEGLSKEMLSEYPESGSVLKIRLD